jgi:hypothetical protein
VGVALLAVVGVLAVGQVYLRIGLLPESGGLLPESGGLLPESGAAGPAFAAINQIAIFSPVLLALALRSQSLDTTWLGRRRWPLRLLVGIGLAMLAVLAYTLLRKDVDGFPDVIARIPRYRHVDEAVQVFLEDLTIAFLFVRLAVAIGARWAIVTVAVLFAAGHIPALLTEGASTRDLLLLLRDAALGTAIIAVLQRSRDILWFWCVHFAMDMLQFEGIAFR